MQPQQIRTICRDCIFAVYQGKTQISCGLDKIKELEASGGTLVEYVDANGTEFFGIQDRICLYNRGKDWAEGKSRKDWANLATEEIRIRYQAIIPAEDSLEDIETTVKSLMSQVRRPKLITVIRYEDSQIPLQSIFQIMKEFNVPKWKVQGNTVDPEFPEHKDLLDAIDEAVSSDKDTQYYVIVKAGSELPEPLFDDLDKKIRNEQFKFGIIKGETFYIAAKAIHWYVNGNVIKPLEEKLRENQWEAMIFETKWLFDYCREWR